MAEIADLAKTFSLAYDCLLGAARVPEFAFASVKKDGFIVKLCHIYENTVF